MKKYFLTGLIVLIFTAIVIHFNRPFGEQSENIHEPSPSNSTTQVSSSAHQNLSPETVPTSSSTVKDDLEQEFLTHLNQESSSPRLISEPARPEKYFPEPIVPPANDKAAKGRKERAHLPLGIVLNNGVPAYPDSNSQRILYSLNTGDMIRIFADSTETRIKIQPGVDVYLMATTRHIEAAGIRYPDREVWVQKENIDILNPTEAVQFTETLDPITLGNDPNFSTVDFYSRAAQNPDPVVRHILTPRYIDVISVHEDYVPAWQTLIRHPDAQIRSLALAALNNKTNKSNRNMIEDLIARLGELGKNPLRGEEEAEVLVILNILKVSDHPRVAVALAPFLESWTNQPLGVQQALVETLDSINQ